MCDFILSLAYSFTSNLTIRRALKLLAGKTSASKQLAAEEKSVTLRRKIAMWQSIQQIYMPFITQLRPPVSIGSSTRAVALGDEDYSDSEADSDNDEETRTQVVVRSTIDIRLFLPSGLHAAHRKLCSKDLLEKECRLRHAQAEDALITLRRHLRAQATIFDRKKLHTAGTGTRPNTRMQALLERYNDKIGRDAARYRAARAALVELDPSTSWRSRLQDLHDSHIRAPARGQDEPSEGRRRLSWIWQVGTSLRGSTSHETHQADVLREGSNSEEDEQDEEDGKCTKLLPVVFFSLFDIGLRVEWAKSLARAERWEEEVLLIREEMRRVLVFLDYKASQWKTKASLRREEDFEYACGFAAYCERQAYIFTSLAHDFASIWLSAIDDTELARPVTWPVKFLTVSQTSKQIQRRRLRTKAIQRVLPAQVVDEDEESRDIC